MLSVIQYSETVGRGRRKILSEAATRRARARARASYQLDNAHPLNSRLDGRERLPISNDVSSSVSFSSSSISFTIGAPLTCHREREREKKGDIDDTNDT